MKDGHIWSQGEISEGQGDTWSKQHTSTGKKQYWIFLTLQDLGFDFTCSISQSLQKGDNGVLQLCVSSACFGGGGFEGEERQT